MNKYVKLSVVTVVVLVLLLAIGASQRQSYSGLTSDPYSYKHLSSTNASSTAATLVRGGAGVLGHVSINTTSGQIIKIYDGDSTATSSATLIAQIVASAGVQTFTYNVAVTKGIAIETPASYTGSLTVSYK